MKRAFKILFGMTFLFALLVLPGHVALAALAKTTSIAELDAWQKVAAGTLDVGAAGDIHLSYDTILYLEIAYADTDDQEGVVVIVEVSYGDDDWTLLTKPFITPAALTDDDDLDGQVFSDGETITLSDITAFGNLGAKLFIENAGAPGSSESVRVQSVAGNVITLCQDLLRNHADAVFVYDEVYEYIFSIPASFAYVRVLINVTDVDSDIYYTTRLSKVTGL